MTSPTNTTPTGFLVIDKPIGPTSHDVVAAVRRLLAKKTKVGHTGTLDPFASGLLIVTIGSATRLGEYTLGQPKTYEATIHLGATSTTDDLTGVIETTENPKQPTETEVTAVLQKFIGDQQQLPPTYAAIKIAGQKMYEYARRGEIVERQLRPITIYSLERINYTYPDIQISVTCSSGTYIRALARDIGEALHSGGYLTQLRRTAIGEIQIENAAKVDDLNQQSLATLIKSATGLITQLPKVTLNIDNVAQFRQGRAVTSDVPPLFATPIAVFDESQNLVGIGQITADQPTLLSPSKVF